MPLSSEKSETSLQAAGTSQPGASAPAANLPTPAPGGPEAFFDSAPAPLAETFRYNYSKLTGLAMLDVLPPSEKPSLKWYLQVVHRSLLAAQNRLAQSKAAPAGPGPLMFSEEEQAPTAGLDLGHLGLGTVNLQQLPLAQVEPRQLEEMAARHLEPTAGGAPASFDDGPGQGSISRGLFLTLLAIAKEVMLGGLTNPLLILAHVLRRTSVTPAGRPTSLEDYRRLFQTFPLPWIAGHLDSDDVFGWLRVAGFNPVVLQRVETLPAKFPVTDAQLRSGLGEETDSLAQAGAEGRLFLCDYAALARVKNGRFPAGPKYCFAPLGLFALPRGTGPRRLKPVAIQCGQDPCAYRVFTPADGEAWTKARLAFTVADFTHHETTSHLARTHLLLEPMVVALHRHLPEGHPVRVLLAPHFEGTLYINDAAQSGMLAPGQEVDRAFGPTIEAARQAAVEALQSMSFNAGMLPADLQARGVLGAELEYPYRDDALEVWRAIETWVTSYVGLHYGSDAEVRGDTALQAWAREIASPDGGRIQGFGDEGDGRIQTVAYLGQALTMILFTASAQHAAVNFPQGDLLTYAPATPTASYRAAPLSRADSELNDLLDYLPPLEIAALQMEYLNLLGGVFYTQLGKYEARHFTDARVQPLLARFQKDLTAIEGLITWRNNTRLGPYPYLLPSRIPQSTNI